MFISQYAIGFEAHLEMVLQNLIALAGQDNEINIY